VVTGQAVVIWDEWVLTAPAAGMVHLRVREGDRVRTGTPVCRVDGHQVVSPAPGVVTLFTDGTEGRLSFAPGTSPPAPQVLALKPQPGQLQEGQAVTVGQPLARVVDTSRMRLCVVLPPAEVAGLAERSRALVRFPDGREITMRPEAYHAGDDRTYGTITLVSGEWVEDLLRTRLITVEIIKERATGLLVPRRALVERDGQAGVFVVKKTLAQWVKVEVKGEKGALVAIVSAAFWWGLSSPTDADPVSAHPSTVAPSGASGPNASTSSAIPPASAFKYAYQNGADFVLAGMFDFEIEEDVKIAREAVAAASARNRPWRG